MPADDLKRKYDIQGYLDKVERLCLVGRVD
jgi:hypothetical protein